MKSFFPRKTQKARKTLNNLLCVTTHTLLNRKADFEMSKASFGLQKAWLSEFKAGFEPYRAKLHLFSHFCKKGDDLQLGISVNMFVSFVSFVLFVDKSLFFIMKRIAHDTQYF